MTELDRIREKNREDYSRRYAELEEEYQLADWLDSIGYFTAPAACKHHGAYAGGLYAHSKEVAEKLIELTLMGACETWQDEISPIKIGLLHDICKTQDYILRILSPGNTEISYVKQDKLWKGHGEASTIMLGHIWMTEEEAACIRYHMGAFTEQDEWKHYTTAVKKYQNVLWTHTADMYVSQVLGV